MTFLFFLQTGREYNGILKFNFTAIGQFPLFVWLVCMLSLDQGVDPFQIALHTPSLFGLSSCEYTTDRPKPSRMSIRHSQQLVYKIFQRVHQLTVKKKTVVFNQRVVMKLLFFPGSNLNGWIGRFKWKLTVQGQYYRLGAYRLGALSQSDSSIYTLSHYLV